MLELSRTFQRSLDRLTGQEQAAVKQIVFDYMSDPSRPGLSLHRVDRARDTRFWTIRAGQDLRIVVYKDGDRSLFCYVGHHDDAYRWAEGRRFETHPVTGAAQIVEIEEVVRVETRRLIEEAESAAPAMAPRVVPIAAQPLRPPLFVGEASDYLLSLGVPPVYLDAVAAVRDEDGLLSLCTRLPEEAAEALLELATGNRPAPAPVVPPGPTVDPFAHPDARRRFWATSDEEELARALERPWAEWLVFLHPSQRAAVDRAFGGPARVSGGAGTGKSVVAMHRAAALARASQGGRILLTTFSKTLALRLSDGMDALLGIASPARGRVEVTHLHAYAVANASRLDKITIADGPLLDFLIGQAGEGLEVPFDAAFLRSEWDAVIDYWGVDSFEAYRDIPRTGRGMSLSPRQRRRLWDVFETVRASLRSRGLVTLGEVCDLLRTRIEADGTHPFRHVVVDEAQDLGPRELRLVAALAAPSPQGLFFAGDVGQRIFRWPFSWVAAGIDVRGRAMRLKVNYRTTAEIRRFSDRLLPSEIVEVDGVTEERGALSVLRGPEPETIGVDNLDGEITVLAERLQGLVADGFRPGEIAVMARTRTRLNAIALPALQRAGLVGEHLSADADLDGGHVVLATLHGAKGLEFRAVLLVGCDAEMLPLASVVTSPEPDVRRLAEERELSLFYVGCTRARDRLVVTWSGAPSPYLARAVTA